MQLDAWFSMIVFTLATVAFYFMGAAVLSRKLATGLIVKNDLDGSGMLRTLSQMYVEALGTWAKPFFLIGAWAVLFKTLYVATAANSRMMADFLHLGGFYRYRTPRERDGVVKFFCAVFPLFALSVFLFYPKPLRLVMIGGISQALMLPLIAGATLYLRYRDSDPRVGPKKLSDTFTWLAFAGIAAVAAFTLFSQLKAFIVWLRG
jgi:hypothetical protein